MSLRDTSALNKCLANLNIARGSIKRLRNRQVDLQDQLELLKKELYETQQALADQQQLLTQIRETPHKKRKVESEFRSEEWQDFQRELEDLVKDKNTEDELMESFERMNVGIEGLEDTEDMYD